jgi:phenylpropionate dioxygenase-like ring-hydroxylating dioxygenase large terminal subunit
MQNSAYENQLGDALEKILGDGADNLTTIAAGLDELGVKPIAGGTWTGDSLASDFSRLAATTGNWGSAGIPHPNDAGRVSPPLRMPISADDILNTGLLNHWYLVCRASDVGPKPVRITRLGRDIALWRDARGMVHAIEDLCPHRGARMSMGHVVEGGLACAYHGVTVDGTGVITGVPPVVACPMVGEKRTADYPAREAAGAIFLYFSDGLSADVPELELPVEMTSDEWSGFLYAEEWDCSYQLPLDNRLDPIHASYLHTQTFTLAYGVKQSTIKLHPTQNGFVIERDNQRGVNIDRTEVTHRPGNNYWIQTDIPYPKAAGGNFFRILSHITPVDANHTYFWVFRCQQSSGWRRDMWRFLYQNRLEKRHDDVVQQDRVMMEGIRTDLSDREMLIQTDIGLARIRRLYRRDAEEQAAGLKAHYTGRAAE